MIMKKIITKSVFVVMALLTSAVTFAQGDFGDGTDPNPTDAPIEDYLWVLGLIGVVYVFYKMKNRLVSTH